MRGRKKGGIGRGPGSGAWHTTTKSVSTRGAKEFGWKTDDEGSTKATAGSASMGRKEGVCLKKG